MVEMVKVLGNVILGNFIENFVEEIQDVEGINRELGGIIGVSRTY